MQRSPGLDLLRAAAIVWVMLYHLASYGLSFPKIVDYGWMGVDLFFVLSGYLVGWQLLKPCTRGVQPRWGQFIARRAFRILPAYLAVLALYFTIPAVRESDGIAPLWQFLTFTTNLFPDYFHNRAYSHAWSLCVEEHFYLLLPPIVWLLALRPGIGKVAAVAIALLVGGIVLRGWLWQHEVAPYEHVLSGERNVILRYVEVIYNPTYTRLDGLLAGVMLALAKAFRPTWWARALERAPLLLVAGLAGVFACMRIEAVSFAGVTVGFPLLAVSLGLVVLAALSPRTWLGRFAVPGASQIAAMSFSLYLTHKQVFDWIHRRFGPSLEGHDLLAFGLYNAAALAAAALLYFAIERPGLLLRDRLTATAMHKELPQPALASP